MWAYQSRLLSASQSPGKESVFSEWQSPCHGQEKYKSSLENSVELENNGILKDGWGHKLEGAPTGQLWQQHFEGLEPWLTEDFYSMLGALDWRGIRNIGIWPFTLSNSIGWKLITGVGNCCFGFSWWERSGDLLHDNVSILNSTELSSLFFFWGFEIELRTVSMLSSHFPAKLERQALYSEVWFLIL